MAKVVVEMDGDEQRLWQSIQRVANQQKKVDDGFRKNVSEAKKWERAGRQAYESTRTPQERYVARLAQLQAMVQRGTINQETYNRSLERARLGLIGAGSAQKGFIGGGIANQLTSVAAGYIGIASAVGLVTRALTEMQRVRDEAGQRITDQDTGRKALRQLADTQKDYDALVAKAEALRQSHGMTPDQAYGVIFEAESAGSMGELDAFADLQKLGADPAKAIKSYQNLVTNFGEGSVGNARQAISALIAAAGPSPVEFDDLAQSASKAAQNFSAIGGDDEELLAMGSVFSKATKNTDTAYELVNSLAHQINVKKARGRMDLSGKDNALDFMPAVLSGTVGDLQMGYGHLKGLDLAAALPQLAAEGRLKSGTGKSIGLVEFLEEGNAIRGSKALQDNLPEVRALTSDINRAKELTLLGQGPYAQKLAIKDPKSEAVLANKQASQGLDLSEEDRYGTINELADAVQAQYLKRLTDRGDSAWMTLGRHANVAMMRKGLGDSNFLRHALDQDPEGNEASVTGTLRAQVLRAQAAEGNLTARQKEEAAAMKEAATDLKGATKNMNAAFQAMNANSVPNPAYVEN